MELRRLRYFVVLARHLHFGRAAAEIGIAQPGLSQQIKVLEKELGAELFVRGRGEVRLTAAGRRLLDGAPELLERSEALVRAVSSAARGSSGLLRVAYTRSGADLRVGELVRGFRKEHPGYRVEALTGWTSWNLELLLERTVDVAFIRGPERPEGVEVLQLGAEEMVVAVPRTHRLAALECVPAAELADEPVVLWPRHQGPAFYDRIIEQVWPDGGPQLVQEEPESEQILAAVAAGAGVSVLDRRRALKLCPPGAVVRPFADGPVRVGVALAWRRGEESPAVRDFVGYSRSRGREWLRPD
ncbi:LysR family transcriptional regulator [Streptomyces orinoci]|uniref:LysR family transcriptional regulator n=1 Tax=Streptomyces orinoci TaxID=67339 RepID=A0ABV3JT47_STRON|nr:LysR family transcriptional regulator [Streptomyces orinoci]